VEELEEMIRNAQRELTAKQSQLKEAQKSWSDEKKGFLELIGELTDLVSGIKDEEREAQEAMKKQAKQEEARLQAEIADIQASLAEAREALKGERDAALEIRNRLLSAEDLLEFEQMRFQKEKQQLGIQIENEKDRLQKIESQFANERERFETDSTNLQQEIEAETTKLQQAETDLKEELTRFEKERNDLRQLLRDQSKKLTEAANKLTREKTKFEADRISLERAFQQEKEKLERTVSFLETEQKQFEEAKTDLEMKIVFEKKKVKGLADQLEQEEAIFRQKKEELERGIAAEKANIENVEAKLEQEAIRMEKERNSLRAELDEQRNLRRLQTKEMSKQFSQVREQLMTRWQDEKRKAREERRSLTEMYEDEILAASNSVAQLEEELSGAKQSSEELKVILDEMTKEKDLLISEREESEERYKRTLENRDGIILDLRTELDRLYDDIYDRDQTIAKYESSLRELLGLSVQLTKRKVGRVFRGRETGQDVSTDGEGRR
jgi:chromosome segregation ATPase